MANDCVVLSPEWQSIGRREAPADGNITTGTFVVYTATGIDVATAATGARMVATENIATAQELDYVYSTGENVHFASLPSGCILQVKAADATYAVGDVLEIGAAGVVTALAAGVPVAVIPYYSQGATISGGGSLIVELL
jgi:hypothetical protein